MSLILNRITLLGAAALLGSLCGLTTPVEQVAALAKAAFAEIHLAGQL